MGLYRVKTDAGAFLMIAPMMTIAQTFRIAKEGIARAEREVAELGYCELFLRGWDYKSIIVESEFAIQRSQQYDNLRRMSAGGADILVRAAKYLAKDDCANGGPDFKDGDSLYLASPESAIRLLMDKNYQLVVILDYCWNVAEKCDVASLEPEVANG